jgi:hypothetical protein
MTALTAALLAEIRRMGREAAEQSARAQGLPALITDRGVQQRVAALLTESNGRRVPRNGAARRDNRRAGGAA